MTTITLITGSTLGGAEYVADHLESVLQAQGYEVALFNQAAFDDLCQAQNLLLITSTHGAGELPDNIKPLFDELEKREITLNTMKFGVIGLGSSDYDTFCNAVNIVEQALTAKGATQLCPSLRIDVVTNFDHDGSAEEWLPQFLEALNA